MVERKQLVEAAIDDLRMLLDRGYRKEYALRFVCDHHTLTKPERNIVMRMTYSADEIERRHRKLRSADYITGRHLAIDGFNVIITLEEAMGADQCFRCQDGMLRDNCMAFANYKIGDGTYRAVDTIIAYLSSLSPKTVRWIFDSQISGSGRLAQRVLKNMEEAGLKGEAITSPQADHQLSHLNLMTATSDSGLIRQLTDIVDLPALVMEGGES